MANDEFNTEKDTVGQGKSRGLKTGVSIKRVLEGRLLAEKLHKNIVFVLFVAAWIFFLIANNYWIENQHRERIALEKEVKELRFESVTKAADLMFIRKQSEVMKRIHSEGLDLQESKEPPIKLYRK